MIALTFKECAMLIQSLDMTDWSYAGEANTAKVLRNKLLREAQRLQPESEVLEAKQ